MNHQNEKNIASIDILLVVYACYSWYWQAKVDFRGRYRISSVVWALIFIGTITPELPPLLSLLLLSLL